jgi:hypothetical protein
MTATYKPSQENAAWLDWAQTRIARIPYKPTARWVFYRLVQEKGFTKDDYKRFLGVTSKARKGYYKNWTPETFADDTRGIIGEYGLGYTSPTSWFESQLDKRPRLEIGHHQDELVIACFEAKAMVGQFKYLLEDLRIPMCPFGGDASIPFKYKIAEMIDYCKRFGDKELFVLYFGDYDPKGLEIPENAMRDIDSWCDKTFTYIRCGINKEHIDKYNIPDQPEAPGKYQWEALDESAAQEIIMDAVEDHWDISKAKKLLKDEQVCSKIWKRSVSEAITKAKKDIEELNLEYS